MDIYSNGVKLQVIGKQGIRGMAGPDGNPIGTIINCLGKTAPEDYLICNGSEHKISEYPELADYFEEQFGKKNYFGGDGEDNFAVPNIPDSSEIVLKCIKATKAQPYEDVYSTEETVIGRWVDGRPIYRKLFYMTAVTSTTWITTSTNIPNMSALVSLRGLVDTEENNIGLVEIPSYNLNIGINSDGYITMFTSGGKFQGKVITIFMEYTKTTDRGDTVG